MFFRIIGPNSTLVVNRPITFSSFPEHPSARMLHFLIRCVRPSLNVALTLIADVEHPVSNREAILRMCPFESFIIAGTLAVNDFPVDAFISVRAFKYAVIVPSSIAMMNVPKVRNVCFEGAMCVSTSLACAQLMTVALSNV
jgi:hypothetical protein